MRTLYDEHQKLLDTEADSQNGKDGVEASSPLDSQTNLEMEMDQPMRASILIGAPEQVLIENGPAELRRSDHLDGEQVRCCSTSSFNA
jgi:hypothetical protein